MKVSKYLKSLGKHSDTQLRAVTFLRSVGYKLLSVEEDSSVVLAHKELPLFVVVETHTHSHSQWSYAIVKTYQVKYAELNSLIGTTRFEGRMNHDEFSEERVMKNVEERYSHYMDVKNGVVINGLSWFRKEDNTVSSCKSTKEIVRSKPQAIEDYAALLKYEEIVLKKIAEAKAAMQPIIKEIL